jgi:hypothetical protein
MPSVVDQIAASFKGAITQVELPDGASALDVYHALDILKRDWVMPEKTHTIEPGPPPEGGEGGEGTPEPETPTISMVEPAQTAIGVPVEVTVTGTGFIESSQVMADGNALVTTYGSATSLGATVPGPLAAGTFAITVDGSNSVPFLVPEDLPPPPSDQRSKRS